MLTGVVLTKNSASTLPSCLKSLSFCDHLLIVDDGSTDDTAKVAAKFSARLVKHPLSKDFSAQRNFALSQVKSGWVLFIDSDEVVSHYLQSEIKLAISRNTCQAFSLRRIDHLWGRPLRFGDTGNIYLTRLAKVESGHWHGRVHEVWATTSHPCRLKNPLYHYPHPTLYSFLHSQNVYSTFRAEELYHSGYRANLLQVIFYPVAKFVYLYFIKLGFLDGTAGFIHAGVMSFYTFLVRSKLSLLAKGVSD